MSTVQYAIRVDLSTSTANLPQAGIDYDPALGYSVMRVITGRPGYDGTQGGVTYEGGAANTDVWHEDMLTKDGMSKPSRRVDLTGTGAYGTLSGFNFTLDSTMIAGTTLPLWKLLKDNDVYLTGQKVRLYAVIDDVFYGIWQGIVYNMPQNEIDHKIVCKDQSINVHKQIPPIEIGDNNYPNANDDSKGESVPVQFGDVPYAVMRNTSGEPEYIVLNNGQSVAAASWYGFLSNSAHLQLITETTTFGTDELAGKYLFVIGGGGPPDKDRGILIRSNNATGENGTNITEIVLEEALEVTPDDWNANGYNYSSPPDSDMWYFSIASLNTENIVSNNSVNGFESGVDGLVILKEFDKNKSKYLPVNYTGLETDTTNSTFEIITTRITKNGEINYLFPIVPTFIQQGKLIGINFFPKGTGTGIEPNLWDLDRTTNMSLSYSSVSDNEWRTLYSMLITLPINDETVDFEKLYFCIDQNITEWFLNATYQLRITFQFRDVYTHTITDLTYETTVPSGSNGFEFGVNNLLPNLYYKYGDDNGEPSNFGSGISSVLYRPLLEIDSLDIIDGIKSKFIEQNIFVNVEIYPELTGGGGGTSNMDVAVKQIGWVAERIYNVIDTNIYPVVSGELYNDTDETDDVYNSFRHILETYDGLTANADVKLGDVEYDNLDTDRNQWHVGRTLDKRKNSFKYLKELAAESFVCIVPNRYGKRRVKAWLDQTTVDWTYTDTPTGGEIGIVRGSVKKYERTKADKIYNEYLIKYNYSPGHKKHIRSYSISNVDQSAFPAVTGNWQSFVSGDIGYADAKAIWERCHLTYEQYGMVRQFEKELNWYIDATEFNDSMPQFQSTGSSAYKFLDECVSWIGRQKADSTISIPLTSTTIATELADYITLNESVYTNGDNQPGYIDKVEYDLKNDMIIVGLALFPIDTIDDEVGDIEETGSASDTIDESGSRTDTVTEGG